MRHLLPTLALLAAYESGHAWAACNIIPGTTGAFRATLATTDRPFATPGTFVELRLDAPCHAGSPSFGATAAEHVVTVAFTPATSASRNLVVLAADCAALEAEQQRCAARPDVASVACLPVNVAPPDAGLELVDARRIRVRFPDTDSLFLAPDDDLTFAGPATIAVTRAGDPLPCELASASCAAVSQVVACVDQLFATDATCDPAPHPVFPHFTALPPPNDYQAICTEPSPPCTGLGNEVRFTIDAAGNVLVPMDWRGVLVDRDAVPVARLLRGSTTLEAFAGSRQPIRIPGSAFLGSFSPEGGRLPPLFDPQADPSATGEATFFGSVDAPETVLRVTRRSPVFRACTGGVNDGLPCTLPEDCPSGSCTPGGCVGSTSAGALCSGDADCAGGECGPSLFDFSTRLLGGVGPVLLRLGACLGGTNASGPCTSDVACPGGQCGSFSVSALDPVPLDGLSRSAETLAFVVAEPLVDEDLNSDGDRTDDVVRLAERATGVVRSIGTGAAVGRAVGRLHEPPFTYPALAVEGDVVAFLEPEPHEHARDANGDGDVFDPILRVFRLAPGGATELTAGLVLTADAAPAVNERALVVSQGLVIFRTTEAAAARETTTRVSVASDGTEADDACILKLPVPSISADGESVAFDSCATNLVPDDGNGPGDFGEDVFVHDVATATTTRVSTGSSGGDANGVSLLPVVSADGRLVAFGSVATDLVAGDANGDPDVFVHDRVSGETRRVSIAADTSEVAGASFAPAISSDGRWVTFISAAGDVVPLDTNRVADVFVHDRTNRDVVRVSVSSGGEQGNRTPPMKATELVRSAVSGDGQIVVFTSASSNLAAGDDGQRFQVFVHDRDTDRDGAFDEPGAIDTVRASSGPTGEAANAFTFTPRVSTDGRWIAFTSVATNLVAGDTNGASDVFVVDRLTGAVERVSVDASGTQADDFSFNPSVSADGHFVAFGSRATNLVSGDSNGAEDVFIHDRLLGLTKRVSLAGDGGQGMSSCGNELPRTSITADGASVAFVSCAPNLVVGDGNAIGDVFVRGPDPTDLAKDVTDDGNLDDTVLAVLDTEAASVRMLCPADTVAVAGRVIAFLRPEAAGPAAGCPTGPAIGRGVDLDGDGAAGDRVVHLWRGSGPVENLALAAEAVALSESHVAATAATVRVRALAGSAWVDTGQAADALAAAGGVIVMLTPEGRKMEDLNGDGDRADRVLQLYDPVVGLVTNVAEPALEFVAGERLVAFRTPEAAAGGRDLNGDGDVLDDVLQVYDLGARRLLNTGQAVTPCRLAACDPRLPYRVLRDTVTFLTFEGDQGEDLNGDGDRADLVLQTFNPRAGGALAPAATARRTRRAAAGGGVHAGAIIAFAVATTGICTDTGQGCSTDAGCPRGTCFVPPGGCVEDTGVFCDPTSPGSCPGQEFCEPVPGLAVTGTCHRLLGPCRSDTDCAAPARCRDGGQGFQRLAAPFAVDAAGAQVFASAGRCVEEVGGRQRGTCATAADCAPGTTCQLDLVVATAADSDADELPDPFDNCPHTPNVDQADTDGDGVGNACARATCGNSLRESREACDRSDATACPGRCRSDCTCACATEVNGRVRGLASGGLVAHVVVNLPAYAGEPIAARVDDGLGKRVVEDVVGPLAPVGHDGRAWRYRVTRRLGLSRVRVGELRAPGSGRFRIGLRARQWFDPEVLRAAGVQLTVTIGDQCVAVPVP